jgi:hypothetical protein
MTFPQLPKEHIERLNTFAADIKAALDRFGAPPDLVNRCGFLFGFAWAQLRKEWPAEQARGILDEIIDGGEKQIASMGQGPKS